MHPLFDKKTTDFHSQTAFSLVEVVVAVGIFAIAIVSVLGLLIPITQSVSEVKDIDDATRVVNIIQSELQQAGFSTVEGSLRTAAQVANDDVSTSFDPANTSYIFFASRNGNKVAVSSSSIWNLPSPATETDENAQKFFEIVLIKNTSLTPTNDPGFLAFTMRLRWPAFRPNGQPNLQHSQKSVLLVPMAITR